MSSALFLKRNLAYLRLSIVTKLQNPVLLFLSLLIGPSLQFAIEGLFWAGCFEASGKEQIGGFTLSQYLVYLLWLLLNLGGANWRFERAMIHDINSGAVNAMLIRPGSFYGLHFGELFGFKLLGLIVLLPLMFVVAALFQLPILMERLPLALLMGLSYLLFIHTINFTIACFAFFFDHVYSLNTTKNMILWFLTGELFPLDLLPASLSYWISRLPFSAGVYLPASYISGRIGHQLFVEGFISLVCGIIIMALLARFMWRKGTQNYTGTGS